MSDDSDNNIFDLIGDAAETIDKVYEDNKELIDRVSSAVGEEGQSVDISDKEPLTQLNKTEDFVDITLEVPGGEFDSASISNDDGIIEIGVGEKVFKAQVPSDVDLDSLEYNFSNGVLNIKIPRVEEEEGDVEVINKDNEGEKMEDNEDGTDK